MSWLKQPGDEVASGEPIALWRRQRPNSRLRPRRPVAMGPHLVQAGDRTAPGTTITYVLANAANMTAATATVASAASMAHRHQLHRHPTAPLRKSRHLSAKLTAAKCTGSARGSAGSNNGYRTWTTNDHCPPKTAVPVDPEVPSDHC